MINTHPHLKVVAFIDDPKILDCAVTPIPGSAAVPLQIVASMATQAWGVEADGSIGQWVGLYEGSVGNEALICVLNTNEKKLIPGLFKIGSRYSIRSMDTGSITLGTLCLQFMGRI